MNLIEAIALAAARARGIRRIVDSSPLMLGTSTLLREAQRKAPHALSSDTFRIVDMPNSAVVVDAAGVAFMRVQAILTERGYVLEGFPLLRAKLAA